MIVPVMAISNLVLTQQIYSEETNGAHAHYREPVPLMFFVVLIWFNPLLECVCLDFTAVICNYYTLLSLTVFSLAKNLQTSYLLADIWLISKLRAPYISETKELYNSFPSPFYS